VDKRKNKQKNVPYGKEQKPKHDVFIKQSEIIEKSEEEGFTGNPENWFSDQEFYSKLETKENAEKKDYYFNSYSSFYIHEEMIKDKIRTDSYKRAIENNPEAFKDKIVLDIGCGTGILSIFAARAGAKHVYGIEFADIADYAREIVKKNNLSDKITIIKSKVEEAVLPVEKVDIIISEWMGYLLLYESMLDTVLYARDKWLTKDGIILPDKAVIKLAAIEDVNYKSSKLDFWNDVGYDVDMTCIKPAAICEPLVDVCDREAINSSVCKIFEIDIYTVKKEDLDFSSSYELTVLRNDNFSGLLAWFDVYFDKLPNKVELSTSPYNTRTHWKQIVFYTEQDYKISKGDILKGSFACRKSTTNFRELDIKISYHLKGFFTNNDFYQLYKLR
jgi:protein arginine N-methyltransferase 1